MRVLSPDQWDRHITGLRSFGILASQAFEYEYNKNRTEGKTGIVKPDLIPTKSIDLATASNETSPKKTVAPALPPPSSPLQPPKQRDPPPNSVSAVAAISATNLTDTNGIGLKRPSPAPSPKTSPRASPLKLIPEVDFEAKPQPTPIEPKKSLPKPVEPTIVLSSVDDQDGPVKGVEKAMTETVTVKPKISTRENGTGRPALVRNKGSIVACKPPNVLVYSDSAITRDSVIATLTHILEHDM